MGLLLPPGLGDGLGLSIWWSAFAFPLTVKLCLKQEGYYTLAHEDEVRCGALDLLLAAADWREFQGSNLTVWQKQLSQASRKVRVNKAVAAYRAQQLKNEPQGGKP